MITIEQRAYLLALAAREMRGASQADKVALNRFIIAATPIAKQWGIKDPALYLETLWNTHFKIIRDTWIQGWEYMQHTAALLYQDPRYSPEDILAE